MNEQAKAIIEVTDALYGTDTRIGVSENKENLVCEITDSRAREQVVIAEQVSPAISQATANGRELQKPSPTASKSCNQSGTGNEKPNCYKCIYRKQLVGDAHSSCSHPKASPMALLLFASGLTEFKIEGLHVRGNTHGVRSGWFYWPMNFDPVWLDICSGFIDINPS
jgi:hypothetical protein